MTCPLTIASRPVSSTARVERDRNHAACSGAGRRPDTGDEARHDPCRIRHHPGGQPRRDRLPHHAHGEGAWAIAPSRSIPKPTPMRCTCAWPTTRPASDRPEARASYLELGGDHRGGQASGRRCDPSGLRLPVGERRLRPRLRGGGPRLHRPHARRHRRHGQQGGSQAAHAARGRALRAGLPGRRSVDAGAARARPSASAFR